MSKHTAGPWRIQESFVNNGQRWSILFRDDSKWLASVLHNNNDESMANAKLMAAAPDLLLALEACYEAMETDNDYDLKIILPDMIKAVIDKAKGEV